MRITARTRHHTRALASLALAAAAAGCADDKKSVVAPPTPITGTVTGVSPSSSGINLAVGEEVTLSATVIGSTGVSQEVVWSSVDPGTARVSASGLVTAVGPGTTEIVVASKADGTKTARVTVSVKARTGGVLRTLAVAPAAVALRAGADMQLAALTEPASSAADVDWKSSNAGVAAVNLSGRVSAASIGSATITAASKSDAQLAAGVAIKVVAGNGSVRSLSLARTSFALAGGKTDQLAAKVDAVGGASTGVTFRSANESVVTVDASGVMTARGTGVAEVSVAAAADPSMTTSAFVTVGDARAAAISIQTVTQDNFGQPASLVDARGQLEATINMDPGDQLVRRVELILLPGESGGTETVVATQEFSPSAAVAAREAAAAGYVARVSAAKGMSFSVAQVGAPSAVVTTAAIAPIALTFNSAAFDTATGAVRHRNGAQRLRARLIVEGGSPLGVASNTVALSLNNRDGFYVTMRNLSSTGVSTATDANGLAWVQAGNGLEIRTVPVLYSGLGVSRRTITFPGIGGAPPRVFTFAGDGVRTDVVQLDRPGMPYQTPTTGYAYTDGERPNLSGVDQRGNPLRLVGDPRNPAGLDYPGAGDPSAEGGQGGAGIINAQELRRANANASIGQRLLGLRIDNVGPACGTFDLSRMPDNWANATYDFLAGYAGGGDAGVGLRLSGRPIFQYRPNGSTGAFVTAPSGTGADIPESPTNFTNLAYQGRLLDADLLGNASDCAPITFGVDKTAPTLAYLSSREEPRIARRPMLDGLGGEPLSSLSPLGADSIYDATTEVFPGVTSQTARFGIRYTDERSGFTTVAGSGPEYRRILRLAPTSASIALEEQTCALGMLPGCTPERALGDIEPVPADVYRRSTVPIYGSRFTARTAGYYTYEVYVVDRAGNQSPTIRKRVAIDIERPQITGMSVPAVLLGGGSATFVPTGTDDLEILAGDLGLFYPQVGLINYRRQLFPLINAPWNTELATPVGPGARFGSAGLTLPVGFIQRIEATDAAGAPQMTAQTNVKPTTARARLWDIKDFRRPTPLPNASSANFDQVLGGSVQDRTAFDFRTLAGSQREVQRWRVLAVNRAAGTITVRVEGPTVAINTPFARVDLIRAGADEAGMVWEHLAGTMSAPSPNDQGGTRFWTYTFTMSSMGAGENQRPLAVGDQIRAIGVSAEGNGLASPIFVAP